MSVKWVFEDYWQGQAKTLTYTFTGARQTFVVPDDVTQIHAVMRGGYGGGIDPVAGGYLVVDIPVTPGETLYLRIGGNGNTATGQSGVAGGYNGGGNGGNGNTAYLGGDGGGGATDIRRSGDSLADRVACAAGAGGSARAGTTTRHNYRGGGGGATTGGRGQAPHIDTSHLPPGIPLVYGGPGGTQLAGGTSADGAHNGALGTGANAPNNTSRNGPGGGGAGWNGGAAGAIHPVVTLPPDLEAAYGVLVAEIEAVNTSGSAGGGGANGWSNDVTVVTDGRGTNQDTELARIEIIYTGVSDTYLFEINPNDGGSPAATKNIHVLQNTGPNRTGILQEGQSQVGAISFSGVIIAQSEYEALELWYDRRALIKLTDDLGRTFYGVFTKFAPKRQRRASNFWYHTYDAEFQLNAYVNASGTRVFGRVS